MLSRGILIFIIVLIRASCLAKFSEEVTYLPVFSLWVCFVLGDFNNDYFAGFRIFSCCSSC